jgi:hypothetical protein
VSLIERDAKGYERGGTFRDNLIPLIKNQNHKLKRWNTCLLINDDFESGFLNNVV